MSIFSRLEVWPKISPLERWHSFGAILRFTPLVTWAGRDRISLMRAIQEDQTLKKIGLYLFSYGVGELSAINGIAGAFAERVPIVLINGAPTRRAFRESLPLHHTLGDYDLPRQMFERVTVANAFISDPAKACGEIDRVISAMFYFKRPVYISIPSDVWSLPCGCENLTAADWAEKQLPTTDPIALNEGSSYQKILFPTLFCQNFDQINLISFASSCGSSSGNAGAG